MESMLSNTVRVLAVDDEEQVHEFYRSALRQRSPLDQSVAKIEDRLGTQGEQEEQEAIPYQIELEHQLSGEAGLKAVEQALKAGQPYAVLLLDMKMPGGWDGLETAARVRQIDPIIRISFISAHSTWSIPEIRSRLQTNFSFLKKPVSPDEILQHVICNVTDWMHEKSFYLEREKSENLLRLLNETQQVAKVGSWSLDLISGELIWSDEVYHLFEIDPKQFTASYEGFLNAIHPDDRELVDRAYTHSLRTKEPYEVEHRLLMVDGRIKWVIERGNSEYSEAGEAIRSKGMILDVTQQKIAEQEREQAMAAKDNFLASMSHELRTPLTSIIGNTELLSEKIVVPELTQILGEIESAGKAQLNLVNGILDMSKIDSGKFSIEEDPYDLTLLIREVQQLLKASNQSTNLTLNIVFEHREQNMLLGDVERIRQILLSLLSNAFKFTLEGEVKLVVTLRGEQLCFEVSDTGIGMNAQQHTRLFRKYGQADNTLSRRYGGAGMGLYISYKLAQLMGGTLTAESVEGEGSTFTLLLPYKQSGQAVSATVRQQGEYQLEESTLRGKVLVVEDVLALQALIKSVIEKMGVEVAVASNGQEAVEQASSNRYDVIFMDMQMPVMDGVEATRALREQGITTPIYALTANVMVKHRLEFEEAGCDGFLSKPVDNRVIQRTLERHLHRKGSVPQQQIELFEWSESCSVGYPVLDQEHQQILKLVAVLVAFSNGKMDAPARGEALKALSDLQSVVDSHLRREEIMMQESGYPDFERHKAHHATYWERISSKYQSDLSDQQLRRITEMLVAWWQKHILEEDAGYKGKLNVHSVVIDEDPTPSAPSIILSDELKALFVEGCRERKEKLELAVDVEAWAEVRELAHMIKGSHATFGYPKHSELAAQLHLLLEEERLDQVPKLVSELVLEIGKIL